MTTSQPAVSTAEAGPFNKQPRGTAEAGPFNKQPRDWKKIGIIVLFCALPIALLVVFTYLPFFQMCGYSFYKMK